MLGLGFLEVLILGVIAFLVFGPVEFPKVARSFMKVFNELRRDFSQVKTELYNVQEEAGQNIRQITDHIQKDWQKELTGKSALKTQKPLKKPEEQVKPHASDESGDSNKKQIQEAVARASFGNTSDESDGSNKKP